MSHTEPVPDQGAREWRVLQMNDHYRRGEPPIALPMDDEAHARRRHLELLPPTGTGTERVVRIQSREVGPWVDADAPDEVRPDA